MAIKAGLDLGFPPVLFAALRYDIAGVFMLGYAWYVLEDPIPRGRAQWVQIAIGSVFLIAIYHALLFIGEQDPAVTSATAAIVVSLNPVLTTGCARVLLPDERLSPIGWLGMLLGLVGVIVLTDPDPSNLLASDVIATGLIFVATLSFSFGSVLTQRSDTGLPIESMEAYSMVGGALLMHGLSLLLGESMQSIAHPGEALLALGYLSIFSSAIGFLIYFELLERLGPIEINLVSYTAPPVAAISGFLVLGERITLQGVLGFSIVLIGFVLLKRTALRNAISDVRSTSHPPADD